ncbi:hypothetical protein [Ralstonia pseudosolanacearum]|uniref:hypothetical protein n=1 Tax=Ralstonia pseudosolanacearum TaxID=1310165 RepID=UPI0018D03918|nr:hypothetical protein [Ralstonia pseudosolanacearum]
MPQPFLPRAAMLTLPALAAALTAACVAVPRGPGGMPYTARLQSDAPATAAAPVTPEDRKKLDALNAKALRESDRAAERAAQAREYVATPYYAPYPYPYYGSYSVFYGSGWRHHGGGWGFSYGAPVLGYPYYW